MDIRHVVVLMLENRSFDCMLGMLYPNSEKFDGLIGTETNTWHKPDGTQQDIQVWKDPALTAQTVCIPDPDPGELFTDIQMQLRGLAADGRQYRRADMSGFVEITCASRRPLRRPILTHHALLHAGPGAGHQPAGARLWRVRPMARLRALPDLAEPLFCPHRNGCRLRQQFADAFPL